MTVLFNNIRFLATLVSFKTTAIDRHNVELVQDNLITYDLLLGFKNRDGVAMKLEPDGDENTTLNP